MDCNRETILDELNDFEKKRPSEISPILDGYLARIAKTGDIMFPWNKLRPLFRRKLEMVLNDFYETCPADNLPILPNVESFKYDVMRTKLMEALDSFQSAPFTIQRLCELVTNPRKHYRRTDKFMRGLEKNILVVSTIEPKSSLIHEINHNGSGAIIVNGLISNSPTGIAGDNSTLSNSNLKESPPLDNFASVFSTSTIASTVTATMEVEVSSMTQDDEINSHLDHSDDEDSNLNNDSSEVESTSNQPIVSAMDTSPDFSEEIEEKIRNQIEPCTSSTVDTIRNVPCTDISQCEISSEAEADGSSSSDTQIVPETSKCILEEENLPSDSETESHNIGPDSTVEQEKDEDLDVESAEIHANEVSSNQINDVSNLNFPDNHSGQMIASSSSEIEESNGNSVVEKKELKKQETMETEATSTKDNFVESSGKDVDETEPMEQD